MPAWADKIFSSLAGSCVFVSPSNFKWKIENFRKVVRLIAQSLKIRFILFNIIFLTNSRFLDIYAYL
jgi:hypothetical protein